MSDFFNSGWSIFVAAITIVGLVACLILLMIASRRRVMAADNTTGRVVSVCGAIAVRTTASSAGCTIGPPADRL